MVASLVVKGLRIKWFLASQIISFLTRSLSKEYYRVLWKMLMNCQGMLQQKLAPYLWDVVYYHHPCWNTHKVGCPYAAGDTLQVPRSHTF